MNRRRTQTLLDMRRFPSIPVEMNCLRLVACLWLSVFVVGCSRKPDVTADTVQSSLVDPKTGKVHAGSLGLADLSNVEILDNTTQGNKALVLAQVKATQDVLGTHYDLSAQLRLHFEWGRSRWELKSTDEVHKWVARGPRQPRPYTQDLDQGGDSGAIQGLMRAHRKAQGNLYSIPMPP